MSPLRVVAAGILALLICPTAYADGPLRGNPVDAVPSLQKPKPTTPPAPLHAPIPAEQAAIDARLAQRIAVRYFDVQGVHAVPFADVTALLTPLAGKTITVAQLIQQTDKITTMYRQRGYPLSFAVVQNQNFANGTVVVTVVEGYVNNVRITGNLGNAAERLRSLSKPITAEKPLTQATLERVLNLMRLVPGVTITPALDLPRRADGASELAIAAERKPVSFNAGVTDLGTGMQPIASVASNSLTPLGEQVKLTAAVPLGTDDVRYYAGEVTVPIASNGLALKVNAYHFEAKPQDDAVEALGFKRTVTNDRIGTGLSYPILLNNQSSLVGTLGMYAVNAKDHYDLQGTNLFVQQDTKVRAANAELHYIRVGETRSSDVSFSVSKGFTGLGATKDIDSNFGYSSLPNVALDFTRENLAAKQTFVLPQQFGVTLAAAAQYSNNILPSSEQITFGSYRFGMGYPQGEASGDKGYGISAELNRRFSTGWQYLSAVQPYVLADYAHSYYNDPSLSVYNGRHLASVAVGFRITDDKRYLFDFNVAKPVGSTQLEDSNRNLRFNANYSIYYDAF